MSRVEFTYSAYKNLIHLLQTGGYRVCSYHNWQDTARCVSCGMILTAAWAKRGTSRVERELGVSSTYFVLLTSDFYNPASKGSVEKLRSIQSMGARSWAAL